MKSSFIHALPERFNRDAVEFALLGTGGDSSGPVYNAILLAGAGSLTTISDDDAKFLSAAHGEPENDPVYNPSFSPAAARYFPCRDEVTSHITGIEFDILGSHKRYLGHDVHDFIDGEGTILTSVPGAYGDSGYGTARGVLTLTGTSRKELCGIGDEYERLKLSREIVRIPDETYIGPGTHFMTMHAGLANENPLPPFFPAGRNSDGLFSVILRRTYPGSMTVWHPVGFLHDHPEQRSFDAASIHDFSPVLPNLPPRLPWQPG